MASTLEKIVNISTPSKPKPQAYDSGAFVDTYVAAQEASARGLSTTADVAAYSEFTGEDVGSMPKAQATHFKESIDKLAAHSIHVYAKTHFAKMFGELDDESQTNFALNYVPENPLEKAKKGDEEKVDPYEVARNEANSSLGEYRKIQEDPKAALDEAMKGGGIFAVYVAMDPNAYLEIEGSILKERAVMAISSYGVGKFVSKTQKGLEQKAEQRDKVIEGIQKKQEEQRRKANHTLTAKEEAELVESASGKLEEYSDVGILDQMYQGVINPLISSVKGKRAEQKAKDEAEKQAA